MESEIPSGNISNSRVKFTAASVCRWTHDAGLNSAPPRGSASVRSHGNLTHLISSRVCLRYCLACKNYYTASFFFSSFFRALPEKTTNKMKTFNPEKVSSILKIVSSLKYKNNEECGKLYHYLQSVHYFIFFWNLSRCVELIAYCCPSFVIHNSFYGVGPYFYMCWGP